MAGGPAVSLNMDNTGKINSVNAGTYLYFLPETTFVSGTQYISDITLFYIVRNAMVGGGMNGIKPTAMPVELYNHFYKSQWPWPVTCWAAFIICANLLQVIL